MGAVSYQQVQPMPYKTIYTHDYHGWRDTMTTNCTAIYNVFTAAEDAALTDVSFYTAADNVEYNVVVYDTYSYGLEDELGSARGTIEHTGYHTVSLDNPARLTSDDRFYIYLEVSHGGYAYDRTSEVPVLLGAQSNGATVTSTASMGESLYRHAGEWHDLNFRDPSANFCLRGLVSAVPELDVEGSLGWTDVKPGSRHNGSFTIENTGEDASMLHWRIADTPDWGTWTFSAREGTYLPSGDEISVNMTVTAPSDTNAAFNGELTVVNMDNESNIATIPISLSTPRASGTGQPWLAERFPLLWQLLQRLPLFNRASGLWHR
jgi:hypothetical protein